jgi:hypothetical protein
VHGLTPEFFESFQLHDSLRFRKPVLGAEPAVLSAI